jgi:plastocyanin
MEYHRPEQRSEARRLPLVLFVLLLILSGCDDFSFYKELGETQKEPLSISPSALKLYVGDSSPYVFSASGGIQPYVFNLISGGGSFDALTATYTAGPSPDAATVQVTDAVGAKREAVIEVTAAVDPIVLSPASVTILPGTSVTFTVIGGSEPLNFQVTSGASFGSVSPTGPREAQFDAFGSTGSAVVEVTDAFMETDSSNITIEPYISGVDYTLPSASATWPGAGQPAGGVCSGMFRVENPGSTDGAYPVNFTVYASTNTSLGGGDAVIDSNSAGMLSAGDWLDIGFSGFWPSEPLSYYLIVAISASDDGNPGNNTLISPSSYSLVVEAVDYRMNPDVWPAPGAVLSACDGSFLLENIGALDGGLPVDWIVYASLDATVGGGDHIVASGGGITRPAGLSAQVAFAGTWPAQPGDYRLIVTASADDDANPANNTLISPASIQVFNEYLEMEANGSWDPTVSDFGQLAAPLANDTGFVLAPGATYKIRGNMETDGADIFRFNTGTASSMVITTTWVGTDTIDAYLHDGTPGLELEGGQIIDGYESFPFDIVGQSYAATDLYLTIGNSTLPPVFWNDSPGSGRVYLVTLSCF